MIKRVQPAILFFFVILLTTCSSENKKISGLENFFRKEVITPTTANRVYVNPIIDKTGQSELPDEIMTRLKSRINFQGRLTVANSIEQSDIEMNIEIFLFTIQPLKFDTMGNVIQNKMRALVSVSVINSKNKNIILKGKEVEGIVVFSETIPPIMDVYSANVALANILTERITTVLIKGWYKGGIIPSKTQ